MVFFLEESRNKYLSEDKNVDWDKVSSKWKELQKKNVCLANKYFNEDIKFHIKSLSQQDQQSLLNMMMIGLENQNQKIGVVAGTVNDYDLFSFYLNPIINQCCQISGQCNYQHVFKISSGQFLLTKISSSLNDVLIRVSAVRNIVGWNLSSKMSKQQRLRFQDTMVIILQGIGDKGTYYSLTPNHKNYMPMQIKKDFEKKKIMFNQLENDNRMTTSGIANNWPQGRGVWISKDQTKIIWVGQKQHLTFISLNYGTDLALAATQLLDLLLQIQKFGLKFAQHQKYGVITTQIKRLGTGMDISIYQKFPRITRKGKNFNKLKQLTKRFGLQIKNQNQILKQEKQKYAQICPEIRFGEKQSAIIQRFYKGLVELFNIEYGFEKGHERKIVYLQECRKDYLDDEGKVDWDSVDERWQQLKLKKVSLANKYWTRLVKQKAQSLNQEDQHRLLNVIMNGLENQDSNVGIYVTRPQDYQIFSFYLEPIIRQYHRISGNASQKHDWNTLKGKYLLTNIDKSLQNVSIRARVARNLVGWNLPSKMSKQQRLNLQQKMIDIFQNFGIQGDYYSLTPGHTKQINRQKINGLIARHLLFNDMTTDNHFTSSGLASDWPYGRGIWISKDQRKLVWVGEQDHLRIISIARGFDLSEVDGSLPQILNKIQTLGLSFAYHPTYGVVTSCPTNIGTGKRQSILGKFPNITKNGKDQKKLKQLAKLFGLQARGTRGQNSQMDAQGTADISPSVRFGMKECEIAQKLYDGLVQLYKIQFGQELPQQKGQSKFNQKIQQKFNQKGQYRSKQKGQQRSKQKGQQRSKQKGQQRSKQKGKQKGKQKNKITVQIEKNVVEQQNPEKQQFVYNSSSHYLKYLDDRGQVDWQKVKHKWTQLRKNRISQANKYFTSSVQQQIRWLSKQDHIKLLDCMIRGLQNQNNFIGVYAARSEDYDKFSFYFQPIIRQIYGVSGQLKQEHNWDVPLGKYLLTKLNKALKKVHIKGKLSRNIQGWNLLPKMLKKQRLQFEQHMIQVFQVFGIQGNYYSFSPDHKRGISQDKANNLMKKYSLFNEMVNQTHLVTCEPRSDWLYGKGIWVSKDEEYIICIGQQDHLKIITRVNGNDIAIVDNHLLQMLNRLSTSGLKFMQHPNYGIITACPSNLGIANQLTVILKFPNITKEGKDYKRLKQLASQLGLHARGVNIQGAMLRQGASQICSIGKIGMTELFVAQKLYNGLKQLYKIEKSEQQEEASCQLI